MTDKTIINTPDGVSLNTENNTSYLSAEETKAILTPFAFEIDKSLFGTPLAAPWKRGAALLIDLMLIAILAETPGEILALVIAFTVFRLGSKKRAQMQGRVRGKKRRAFMRFVGALIIFVVLVDTLPNLLSSAEDLTKTPDEKARNVALDGKELTGTESIAFAAIVIDITAKINKSDCNTVACWQEVLSPSIDKASALKLDSKQIQEGLEGVVEFTELNEQDREQLKEGLLEHYNQKISLTKNTLPVKDNNANSYNQWETTYDDNINNVVNNSVEKNTLVNTGDVQGKKNEQETQFYSVMKLVKGIIDDLGLEFGWAAFYFTAFTALWKGQTPGKKLLKIRVLQLDGTPLSLSDSFGRYGGYGAGIATGLLGFAQIYWDPNRQAIHDKISATVVMDLTKI